MEKNVHKQISTEVAQSSPTRRRLFSRVERFLEGRALVTYFTSFVYPVQIDDFDCDMLQSVLQQNDLSKGLALMISTPGGDGLAAERIVNTCRSYSSTGDYWVIVPSKAKSAGTIICMGASKVMMAPVSELGPVDPQIIIVDDNGRPRFFSAHSLVSAYDDLFKDAVTTTGRIEPYIQQLDKFDVRDINQYRSLIDLADSIVVKLMISGAMQGMKEDDIRKKFEVFLNPKAGTLIHSRAIHSWEAKQCGLNVEELDVKSEIWKAIYELYARTDRYVMSQACKAVESKVESFYAQVPHDQL